VAEPAPRPCPVWATVVATGLGSGFSPVVPGTAGSAVGLLLFLPLPGGAAVFLAIGALFFVGGIAAGRVAERSGRKDPGIVVVDEILGMWTALALLPPTLLASGLAFALFRAMDVWKPYPARDLERLPSGWGIMADDLVAGFYASLLTRIALLLA